MEVFKIRCSAIGQIMTGSYGLTDVQTKRYNELFERNELNIKPLTAKMVTELQGLQEKKDNPQLSETAKSYCEMWVKEKLYERRKEISSKEMEKGILCEDSSIEFAADVLDWGMVFKNEDKAENEYMTGECDVNLSDTIADLKNSWDFGTFPLFVKEPDKKYWWQLQGYMELYDKPKAQLVYTLMDLPEDLMLSELMKGQYAGKSEDEVREYFTYSNLPDKLRVKKYDFERENSAYEQIKERVIACRKYIDTELLTQIQ